MDINDRVFAHNNTSMSLPAPDKVPSGRKVLGADWSSDDDSSSDTESQVGKPRSPPPKRLRADTTGAPSEDDVRAILPVWENMVIEPTGADVPRFGMYLAYTKLRPPVMPFSASYTHYEAYARALVFAPIPIKDGAPNAVTIGQRDPVGYTARMGSKGGTIRGILMGAKETDSLMAGVDLVDVVGTAHTELARADALHTIAPNKGIQDVSIIHTGRVSILHDVMDAETRAALIHEAWTIPTTYTYRAPMRTLMIRAQLRTNPDKHVPLIMPAILPTYGMKGDIFVDARERELNACAVVYTNISKFKEGPETSRLVIPSTPGDVMARNLSAHGLVRFPNAIPTIGEDGLLARVISPNDRPHASGVVVVSRRVCDMPTLDSANADELDALKQEHALIEKRPWLALLYNGCANARVCAFYAQVGESAHMRYDEAHTETAQNGVANVVTTRLHAINAECALAVNKFGGDPRFMEAMVFPFGMDGAGCFYLLSNLPYGNGTAEGVPRYVWALAPPGLSEIDENAFERERANIDRFVHHLWLSFGWGTDALPHTMPPPLHHVTWRSTTTVFMREPDATGPFGDAHIAGVILGLARTKARAFAQPFKPIIHDPQYTTEIAPAGNICAEIIQSVDDALMGATKVPMGEYAPRLAEMNTSVAVACAPVLLSAWMMNPEQMLAFSARVPDMRIVQDLSSVFMQRRADGAMDAVSAKTPASATYMRCMRRVIQTAEPCVLAKLSKNDDTLMDWGAHYLCNMHTYRILAWHTALTLDPIYRQMIKTPPKGDIV